MGKDQVMFRIGDLVFAKVRGYPPWPAKITRIIDGRPNNFKYGVHFFGTAETATIFHKGVCSYRDNRERLGKPGKRKFFKEGLEEIERELREIEEKEEKEEDELDFLPDGSPIIVSRSNKRMKNGDSDDSDDSETSRSGRVIKPKRFMDDVDEELKSKCKPSTSGISISQREKNLIRKRGQDMGRLMWAKTKCGQMVQIKLDVNRPATFKDDKARIMWEKTMEVNAKRLKAEIEAGQITSDDIKLQLRPTEEQKAKLSAKELFEMKRSRIIERKRGKLRWLKLETRLVDMDVLIKYCLQKSKVDIQKALSLMDELIDMPLDPLMLKKHPQVVDTAKKLRQYIGNAVEWNYTREEAAAFETWAFKVRQKANSLFNKYTSLFAVPETNNFWSFFLEAVSEFWKLTQDMSRERVFGLIIDPASPYYKDVCADDKEEEEFKLKYDISAERYIAKRRARRAAGKR